jgi:hypothetical protein
LQIINPSKDPRFENFDSRTIEDKIAERNKDNMGIFIAKYPALEE